MTTTTATHPVATRDPVDASRGGRSRGITGRLARFVSSTGYADLPAHVVRLAKQSFLDTVGIALNGMNEAAPRILAQFARDEGAAPRATVMLLGFRTSACHAALVNGTAADIEGYSDVSVVRMHHPSVSPLAAVWALGEQLSSSGRDVLTAHVLGVEVANKIAAGVRPGLAQKGWHPLAVLGTFGAAAAAARLLGLDAERTGHALGIAGSEASGMRVSNGTMSKAYGAGRSARDGLAAALLAARGFTGAADVIEGRDGFLQTFGDGVSGEGIIERLGSPYDFESPGIALKKFPSCTRSHSSIQAVLNLRQAHGLAPDGVRAIECLVTPAVMDYLKFPAPRDKFEAKYSLEYCVASAIVRGTIDLESFEERRLSDPVVRSLMKKTKVAVWSEFARDGYSPAYAPNGCVAKITTDDGRTLVERVDKDPWDPLVTPPTWEDVVAKFTAMARPALGTARLRSVVSMVSHLEELTSVADLMALLGEPPGSVGDREK